MLTRSIHDKILSLWSDRKLETYAHIEHFSRKNSDSRDLPFQLLKTKLKTVHESHVHLKCRTLCYRILCYTWTRPIKICIMLKSHEKTFVSSVFIFVLTVKRSEQTRKRFETATSNLVSQINPNRKPSIKMWIVNADVIVLERSFFDARDTFSYHRALVSFISYFRSDKAKYNCYCVDKLRQLSPWKVYANAKVRKACWPEAFDYLPLSTFLHEVIRIV